MRIKGKRAGCSAGLGIGMALYIMSCLWINFFGKQWYSFDIYSDALLAKIMVEQGSIFPNNWVFGNQFYVVATPVLSAALYAILHNSVLAMAAASSIMMFVTIGCFNWAVKPFLDNKCRMIGLFCLSGATVLGNSASSYANGLQYFYTMASFYACYVITILLTLGVYFRIQTNKHCSIGLVIISGALSFALGMQSLRQMLVLYLPLCTLAVLMFICKTGNKKSMLYAAILTVINLAGGIAIKFVPVKSAPIISEISLTSDVYSLIKNIKATSSAFLGISGLGFVKNGIKWMPLFVAAIFITGVVIITVVDVVHRNKSTVLGQMIMYCVISLLAVYGVGVFLFRVRAIYFFVWYLLVVFSFIYAINEFKKIAGCILVILCLVGMVNYITNFYPDFSTYAGRDQFYKQTANELMAEGIDCVYYDIHTSPLLAAYSDDNIISGTVCLDINRDSGGLMYPVSWLKPIDIFKNVAKYNSYIVFSNWTFDYLERAAPQEYIDDLFAELQFVRKVSYGNEELCFYRFSPLLLNVEN